MKSIAISFLLSGLLMLGLAACSTTTSEPLPEISTQPTSATVVVGSLDGAFGENTKLSWYPSDFIELQGSSVFQEGQKQQLLEAVKIHVEQAFAERGLVFNPEPGSTRFQVVVAGAADNQTVSKLEELFKVYPGLIQQNMTAGTVMLAVVDTARNFPMWRAAVEGAVQPDLTYEQRLEQIKGIIDDLMARTNL